MSLDPPRRWFNWVVWVTGGKEGALGHLWVPTLEEEANERYYRLERRKTELEMDEEQARAQLAATEQRTRRLWADEKREQARAEALRIHSCQQKLRRMAVEMRLVENELHAVGQVRAGNVVQESVMFRARALRERFDAVGPQQMQRVLMQMEQLQSFDQMSQESIDDMYREADERAVEQAREASEKDGDGVESVLESLGLVAAVEQAPSVPSTPPGSLGPSERS